ncbi:ras guanine nucleotide exchange factor, slime mold, putative [Entamoeba dispar SAW760]|uniref:Ras guanine nucleotide exchange factor, slime mold, putative n=1 Tax=Entamoeba dispar (strain ATCC PRA-260 / SAW760) TaxID=370354 RepID=B0ECX5_ENTDS|nr:ras guanine nucleotide exchange factor, slime mold, putative [Entamoeba dispar SAW760]EDR27667.1 ras guanine nucleotide exchange factor, slime mold, putative [Entamoeba dispar SAW760]|eukprot:EDR27667.1 ras guanine nucleotide exchange factor, slime mold, putative [Entamoeba dispar SAW760]
MLGLQEEKLQQMQEEIQSLKLKVSLLQSEKYKKMRSINMKALAGDEFTDEEKKMLQAEISAIETLRNELQKEPIRESRSRRIEQKRLDRHSLSLTFRKKKNNVISFTASSKLSGDSVSINGGNGTEAITETLKKAKEKGLNKEEIIDQISNCINKYYQDARPIKVGGVLKNVDEDVIVEQKSNTRFYVHTQLLPRFDEITIDEEVNRLGEEKVKSYDTLVGLVCDSAAVVGSVVIDALSFASLAVARPEIEEYISQFQSAVEAVLEKASTLMEITQKIMELYVSHCECNDENFKKYIETYKATITTLNKIKLEPEINSHVVSAAKGEGQQLRAGFIERDFYESGKGLSAIVSQLIVSIGNVVRNRITKTEDNGKKKKKEKIDEENPFVLNSKDIVKLEVVEVGSITVTLVNSLKIYVGKVYTAREVRKISENETEKLTMGTNDFWNEIESQDKPKVITKKDSKSINAGSLNRIIETLTSPDFSDLFFRRTFFYSFPSFAKAKEVVDLLITRYLVPDNIPKEKATLIKRRVVIALKYFCSDALDECNQGLLEYIKSFLNRPEETDQQLKSLTATIDKRLYERNQLISNYFIPPVDLFLSQDMCSPALFISKMDDYEIAKQLTMVDFGIYKNVRPTELFDCSFDKMKYRAPNVCKMLARVDEISHWIGTMILMFPDVEMRAKLMNKFISVADKLLTLQNYQALAGFYVGLEAYSPISRLQNTRNLLTQQSVKTMKILESYFGLVNNSNYKNYRSLIKDVKGACVPFIAVVTKDLTFITEGNEPKIKNEDGISLINFERQEMCLTQIDDFLRFQQFTFNFPIVQPLNGYLQQLTSLPEDLLYRISVILEPRKK